MGDADAFFLAAELGWASMSMSISISRSADNATWEALIFSLSSMNGLFLPILSAIVVSRICDMEHKGDTWKMLMTTSVGRQTVYAAKFVCAGSLLLYGILAQVVFLLPASACSIDSQNRSRQVCCCSSLRVL
ncbi:ABC transporter permease [Paenibacillus rhizoplanae]